MAHLNKVTFELKSKRYFNDAPRSWKMLGSILLKFEWHRLDEILLQKTSSQKLVILKTRWRERERHTNHRALKYKEEREVPYRPNSQINSDVNHKSIPKT